jgi:hypothetical protein
VKYLAQVVEEVNESCAGEEKNIFSLLRLKMGGRVKKPGLRGGSWNNDTSNLRVSDRNNAAWTNTDRNNNVGFRPASTPYQGDNR